VILLIDHDDSFVFTLAGYVSRLGADAVVRRATTLSIAEVISLQPAQIILSPGPGAPEACALALEVVDKLAPIIPILGVCLGHQVIAIAYGAIVERAGHPRHGLTSSIAHDGRGIFEQLATPLLATRYHSLSVRADTVKPPLQVTASADDGEVMGLRHTEHRVEGVQFHPESVLTEHGLQMIANFIGK
jgi:anthranilate synthase/aminodeoxychorismate synthase-like glutamine amidotransferase